MTPLDVDLRALAARAPVHFVGVAGAGMCALAELLVREGGRVSGCDAKDGRGLRRLASLGADVHVGHAEDHAHGTSAVVVSSAVPADHPELLAAHERGIPVLKRAQALAALVSHGRVVAVAGTHGKTTTTALATEMLAAGGLDPTGVVGGRVPSWGGNLRFGRSDLFVVEADEYDRSFHTLTPDVAVVTNVEADHLDVYGDLDGVRTGFRAFLARVRAGGRVVACADDPGAASLLAATGPAGYSYGRSAGSMLRVVDARQDARGGAACRVTEDGVERGEFTVAMAGVHNLLNALAAAAVARRLGVGWEAIRKAAAAFPGVGRRFERLGERGGITVVDDYAHHPTEIRAALEAARSGHPGARLVAVFQPHLYSRTRDFLEGFGGALAGADTVWVTDVFPAREAPIPGIDGALVASAVREAGAYDVRHHAALDGLADAVAEDLRPGDVVLTLGAGSVEGVGPEVLRRIEERVHA